jgi:hypothetical protein
MSVSYMYLRSNGGTERPVVAKIKDGDEIKSWVEFRGTEQKGFYEVRKAGDNVTPVACFFSMAEGVDFAKRRFCS